RSGCRPLDPEFDKGRELLAGGQPGINGEAARGYAVYLTLAQSAEVARAKKYQHLVLVLRRVDRIVDPKAGKTQTAHAMGVEFVGAVVEKCRVIMNLANFTAVDFVNPYRTDVVEAEMEERNLEGQFSVVPKRAVWLEADLAEMIVVDTLELVG